MDNIKTGALIRRLRKEHNMTQLQLAQKLNISDKAVSKWERGLGSPDVSLLSELSEIFCVDISNILSGELKKSDPKTADMKKMKFFICPHCGNLITSFVSPYVSCCGRTLSEIIPVKAPEEEKLTVEIIENDYFISSSHEMSKEHYITFVALITTDTLILKKQYPEWDLRARIPRIGHGRIVWHCSKDGLFYMEV